MIFDVPLLPGILLRRYKRFLADIRLDNGAYITAHCPNSGSLKSCNIPGNPVFVSSRPNPARKLKYTWEMIRVNDCWVGINTLLPNQLVSEAITNRIIRELAGYHQQRREVKYGKNSRIDLLLETHNGLCYVEVKNVTLVENRTARFPDAITERGQKHLKELMAVVRQGQAGTILFLVQREDAETFSPADEIDPVYGKLLRQAVKKGVKLLVYQARVTPTGITIFRSLPAVL